MFERQFLKRFTPDGDGFLYRSWLYGAARFSPAEVEAFVRMRRRIWSSPVLWALVLVFGIAMPAWFVLRGGADGGLYAGLCLIPGLFGPAVLLLWAETAPASAASDVQAARSKRDDGPDEPPSRLSRAVRSILFAFFLAYYAYQLVIARSWSSRAVLLVAVLAGIWCFLPARRRRLGAKPRSRL